MTVHALGRRVLLDMDPDLGRLLDDERWRLARQTLSVRTTVVPVGEWDVSGLARVNPANIGLLLVEGVIAREISLTTNVSSELLGPGDLIRPWTLGGQVELLEAVTYWNVLAEVRIAVLDRSLTARLSGFPEVTTVLMDRMSARSQRLAMLQAIAHLKRVDARLEAALWLIAERWGRVTEDGVTVPLALSHRAISQIVGAARPSVSTAFSSLAAERRVVRRGDGTWWLNPACRPSAAPRASGGVRQRRHLFPASPDVNAADWADGLGGPIATASGIRRS